VSWNRADRFHALGELDVLVVHQRTWVEGRIGHDTVDSPALHAEVPGIVDRENSGLAEILLEQSALLTPTTCMRL
jgi:hypothetical protein